MNEIKELWQNSRVLTINAQKFTYTVIAQKYMAELLFTYTGIAIRHPVHSI